MTQRPHRRVSHRSRTGRARSHLLICCALACGITIPASAGAQSYGANHFAGFAPRTALDMVRLIPGFVIAEAEERRGFGTSEANVLIDGRPIHGKSNDAVDALSRIAAKDVGRIELTSSTSTQATGVARQIANVVLVQRAERMTGRFSWRPSTRARDRDIGWFGGDASFSGKQGRLEYSVGVRNDALRTGASGPSRIFAPSGNVSDVRQERYLERSDQPRIGADVRYETPGGTILGLRGSLQRFRYQFRERSERSGEDLVDRARLLTQRQRGRRQEIGGDVELGLGAGQLKLIALHARERNPIDTRVTTLFADGSDPTGNRFMRDGDERETIVRSEYRWSGGNTDWLLSAERAVTGLDNVSALSRLLPGGSFEEVPLPGASGRVRERRHEAAITMVRRLAPGLTLQTSVGGEISQLRLVGDVASDRTFRRPKGYVSVAWHPNSRLRASAKVERRVGQISFFDFLASRNLFEDRENQANAQLVPPQSWNLEGELTRALGRVGSTTLRLYGQRIEDLVEQIPVGFTGEAPGNVDTAYVYGADWKSTLLLDGLGWAGGRLDARAHLQGSSVEDPVTGRKRPISNNLARLVEVSLRHDVPGTLWAWGAGLYHIHRAADFRVAELARYRQGPLSGNVYVEHKDVLGLTVRAGVSNLLSSRQELDRFIYESRRDEPLLWIERRRRSVGPAFSFSVSGNF